MSSTLFYSGVVLLLLNSSKSPGTNSKGSGSSHNNASSSPSLVIMGGFDFEWKGKLYVINTEGGCPFFESDEEEKAFEEWRVTKEGIQLFGPVPTDWSKEHYLDDRYPWDPNRDCRVDVENIDCDPDDEDSYYDEPYIDWASYDKCRFNCYRHFLITNKAHECAKCGVMSCKECARGCFKECSGEGCNEQVCGCDCEYCDCCEEEVKQQSKRDKKKKKKNSH